MMCKDRQNQAIEKGIHITVLLKLRDDTQCALNSKVAIALFADYSKTFDTIRYDILLKKLNELDFFSSFIYLINSYLTNRYQFIKLRTKNLHYRTLCVVFLKVVF